MPRKDKQPRLREDPEEEDDFQGNTPGAFTFQYTEDDRARDEESWNQAGYYIDAVLDSHGFNADGSLPGSSNTAASLYQADPADEWMYGDQQVVTQQQAQLQQPAYSPNATVPAFNESGYAAPATPFDKPAFSIPVDDNPPQPGRPSRNKVTCGNCRTMKEKCVPSNPEEPFPCTNCASKKWECGNPIGKNQNACGPCRRGRRQCKPGTASKPFPCERCKRLGNQCGDE